VRVGATSAASTCCSSVTHVSEAEGLRDRFTSRGRARAAPRGPVRSRRSGVAWARGLSSASCIQQQRSRPARPRQGQVPSLDDMEAWLAVASLGAGRDRGVMMVPQQDEAVLVGFLHGDPDAPHVLGSLVQRQARPGDELSSPRTVFAVAATESSARVQGGLTLHTTRTLWSRSGARAHEGRPRPRAEGRRQVAATADGASPRARRRATRSRRVVRDDQGNASVTIESPGLLRSRAPRSTSPRSGRVHQRRHHQLG
jgi:uncharacterized protein involved in type VI secretion and phage assembly